MSSRRLACSRSMPQKTTSRCASSWWGLDYGVCAFILVLFQGYPMDERHWLLGTAYNTGIECLQCVVPLFCSV